MALRYILKEEDRQLYKVSREVKDYNDRLHTLLDDMRELSDAYIEKMNACTSEAELAAFFVNVKGELYSDETYKAALSTAEDSASPYAVYSRWFEKLWPSAE